MSRKSGKKKSRGWITIVLFFVVIAIGGLIGGGIIFGPRVANARTNEKIKENLYVMENRGNYGLDEYLMSGGGKNSDELADYLVKYLSGGLFKGELKSRDSRVNPGCASIAAKDEKGRAVYGRNYDYAPGMTMVLHTIPEDGYESVSTTALEFLGFGEEWKPEGITNNVMAQAAIYIPMDGMNEKGLYIADLFAGDDEETHQDGGHSDITTTVGIRLCLDKAANVEEALQLLRHYDMHSDIGKAHHYAIADKSGRSVVVEYIDGEMIVTETPIVTNHYISEGKKQGVSNEATSHERFETLENLYAENNGVMSALEVRDALRAVSVKESGSEWEETRWSLIYEPETLSVHMYADEDWSKAYQITLHADEWFIEL